jgi:hypothetical protein
MKYWYGYYFFDQTREPKPGPKSLAGPFDSYREAEAEKHKFRGPDIFWTDSFPASSREEATAMLATQAFTRI